jgi:hypothetical protein
LYRFGYMPPELVTLLRRDHADLQTELTHLLDPTLSLHELRIALDGVRLGLTAHAEAEDIVLGPLEHVPGLERLVHESRAAHLAQESALANLVSMRLGTPAWRDRAHHLRELVRYHAQREETELMPSLAGHPDYGKLAAAFATERLRQLAMLQPSVPVYIPDLAAAV